MNNELFGVYFIYRRVESQPKDSVLYKYFYKCLYLHPPNYSTHPSY